MRYYGITLAVCPSVVCQSVFSFPGSNLSKYQWIFTRLCPYFHFLTITLVINYQWIFTKLSTCLWIDIVDICFGIANGRISSIFDSYLPSIHPYFTFRTITWINLNGFSPNLICAVILWRSALGLLISKFYQFLTVIWPRHDNDWILLFHILLNFCICSLCS